MSIKLQKRGDTYSLYVPNTVDKRPALRATGVANLGTAKKVATMVANLRDRGDFALLNAVVKGETSLFDLYQAQVENKQPALKTLLKRVELEPLIEPWLSVRKSKGLTPASVLLYGKRMRKLFRPPGEEAVRYADELVAGRIEHLLAALGVTSGTTRQYLHELSSFCRYLVGQRVLDENPAANRDLIDTPKKNRGRRRWVREQVDQAIVMAADTAYRHAFAFVHSTGADRSDVLRLRCQDVNHRQACVDIDGNLKADTRRRMGVPIEAWGLPYLRAACNGKKPDDLVFEGLSLDGISRAHARATARAGVEDYWLRDGRHSYAIRAILRGAALADVSEWMGHANMSITYETYVHFDGEVKRMLKSGSGVRAGERDASPRKTPNRTKGRASKTAPKHTQEASNAE